MGDMPNELDALFQMTSGLQYIHSKGFVHLNVKPENVLISPSAILKISDFGFCKPVSSGSFSFGAAFRSNRIFFAPEYLSLEGKSREEKKMTKFDVSVDIFALGCLFYTFLKKGDHLFAKPGSSITNYIVLNILSGKKFLNLGMFLFVYCILCYRWKRVTLESPEKKICTTISSSESFYRFSGKSLRLQND